MIRLLLRNVTQLVQGASRLPALCQFHRSTAQLQQMTDVRCRWFSLKNIELTEGEKLLTNKLKQKFPGMKFLEVRDISGGCGAMYQISIEAEEFKGLKTVMMHRMVQQALEEEIKHMHGLQLNTKPPSEDS